MMHQPFLEWTFINGIHIYTHPDAFKLLERNDNNLRWVFEQNCNCKTDIGATHIGIRLHPEKHILRSKDEQTFLMLENLYFEKQKTDPAILKIFSTVRPDPIIDYTVNGKAQFEKLLYGLAALVSTSMIYIFCDVEVYHNGFLLTNFSYKKPGRNIHKEIDLSCDLKNEYGLELIKLTVPEVTFLPRVTFTTNEPLILRLSGCIQPLPDFYKSIEAMEYVLDLLS